LVCDWGGRQGYFVQTPKLEYTESIRQLIIHQKNKNIRKKAVKTYYFLTHDIELMRKLLSDEDSYIRGLSVGYLLKNRDFKSIKQINKTCYKITNAVLRCKILEELKNWSNIDTIPGIISFLEDNIDDCIYNTPHKYQYIGSISINAKLLLKNITGCNFPNNIELSKNAWAKVKNIKNSNKKIAALKKILSWEEPLINAFIKEEKDGYYIEITNMSKKPFVVTKRPPIISLESSDNIEEILRTGDSVINKSSFINILPNKTHIFHLKYSKPLKNGSKVILFYTVAGKKFGVNSWIGTISVKYKY